MKIAENMNENVNFKRWMHQAAERPQDFLNQIKEKEEPEEWEIFWACYAAIRLHDEQFKEHVYEEFVEDCEEGNDYHLLLAYEKYLEYLDDPDYTVPVGGINL